MRIKAELVYTFDELNEKAKERAVSDNYGINVDYGWWECTYTDAKEVGIKITAFDINRGNYIKGDFLYSAVEVAARIIDRHGKDCETYKTAKEFAEDNNILKDKIYALYGSDDYSQDAEQDLQDEMETLCEDFEKSILEDYVILLRKEYEYLTSKEQVIETLQANGYEFLASGKKV
jgi:hypothetical protein